ncbi:MAG TPA: methyl-accepting chemotaxis protein [Noviherbaspirillum sp.]|uniref:methyl-accepting chemotaxis protein n=1 Tax=Noviherbaspirillum sp. TaxID=1926288 RepID=UPI002D505143|nr:methyl-accepting chemotaxis protein [Noviherbaspirillum sp.]HYD96136.1 methyl-accepting chemotaxis protein [Noviherbaspirillum sp.]
MRIHNLKIGTRLGLGFSLVLALMLALIGAASVHFSEIEDATAHMIDKEWVKSEAANKINATVAGNAKLTLELFVVPDQAGRDRIRAHIDANKHAITGALATLESLVDLPQDKAMLETIKTERARYVASFTRVSNLIEATETEEARKVIMEQTLPQLDKLQAAVVALAELQKQLAQTSAHDIRESSASGRHQMLALGAFAVALGILLAWLITRSITRPIAQAVDVAHTVAAGDLTSVIEVNATDETGQLLGALRDMNDHLAELVSKVRGGTETVSAASAQIAAGNLDLSSRTEEQASSLEETAASMEELLSTVKQNAQSAAQANALASSASDVALKGGTMVAAVVDTMDAINQSSKRIADIITVIDSIAFQTNILALNAAVEAARAGEQGRGFAVVASEVRVLAQRSATAAREIKELIGDSVDKVDNGCRLVEQAGSTMDEIVVSVRRVSDIMAEIAAATNEQTAGIDQINQAICQMDETTQQNASLVEESAAAAASLEAQARGLAQAVALFKVNGELIGKAAAARPAVPALPDRADTAAALPAPRYAHAA